MQIEILGSSAAWPIPRLGCGCVQCAEAREDPALRRSRTGIWIEGPEGELLLDASADVYAQLERRGVPAPEDVLLSHAHEDHCLGIGDASHTPFRGIRRLRGHASVLALMEDHFAHLFGGRRGYRSEPLRCREPAEVAGLRLTGLDVHHSPGQGFTTLGFLIEEGDRSLFLSTDFKALDPEDLERVAGADLWIMDGSGMGSAYPTHAPMLEELALRRSCGGGPVLFTHVGHLRMANREILAEVTAAHDGLVWVALDGTRVTLTAEELRVEGAVGG